MKPGLLSVLYDKSEDVFQNIKEGYTWDSFPENVHHIQVLKTRAMNINEDIVKLRTGAKRGHCALVEEMKPCTTPKWV